MREHVLEMGHASALLALWFSAACGGDTPEEPRVDMMQDMAMPDLATPDLPDLAEPPANYLLPDCTDGQFVTSDSAHAARCVSARRRSRAQVLHRRRSDRNRKSHRQLSRRPCNIALPIACCK